MFTLPINAALREISEFCCLCDSYQAKITQVIRSFFYMWEIPFTLVFTCLFSRYFEIMWPQVCFSLLSTYKVLQKNRRKCHRSIKEKGTVTNAKSLFVGGLEVSPKKSSHRKNAQTFCHKNSKARGPWLMSTPSCRVPVGGGITTTKVLSFL